MNMLFEGEKARLAEAHAKELEKNRADHKSAMDRLEKQKENEKAKIQKDADARVKAAQKEADKKAKAEIKAEVNKAQAQAKEASKKAAATAAMYKKELKLDRGVEGLYKYDFTYGALGVQSLKAMTLSASGTSLSAIPNLNSLMSVFIVKDKKKVTVYSGRHNRLEVVKNFRGTDNFEACKDTVKEQLKNGDKSCAYLTYKTMDRSYVNGFAGFLESDAGFSATQVFHNKSQKNGKSIIGIYFYRG